MGKEMGEAREELHGILRTHGILLNTYGKEKVFLHDLISWHTRHSPTVTRHAVGCMIERFVGGVPTEHEHKRREQLINDLLALLGGEPKTAWCQHCRWETCPPFSEQHRWRFYGGQQALQDVADTWDMCPVKDCHAPRPTP